MKLSRWQTLCLVIMVLSGCATMMRDFGKFVPDDGVTRSFETYQLDPDMNYYFSGSESYPNAIIGLKKKYVLDNDLWQPIKHDPQIFYNRVYGMQYFARDNNYFLHGFIMESPAGEPIGIWYSRLFIKMRVQMSKDNRVVVYTPDLIMYESGGREGRRRMMNK